MITKIMQIDWLLISRSKLAISIGILLVGFVFLASWNGKQLVEVYATNQTNMQAYEQQKYTDLKEALTTIEQTGVYTGNPFADPRTPSTAAGRFAARFVLYPISTTAVWNIGEINTYPSFYRVTATKKQAMILNEEIANPIIQFIGNFDLAYVIIYILPLLIIAFTYDIISGERETDTVRMVLSQPIAFKKIMQIKFGFRFLLFTGTLLIAIISSALIFEIMLNDIAINYIGSALLWTLCWFSLSFFVGSLKNIQSGSVAASLVATWLLFVLLIPGIIAYLSNFFYPMPQRMALINETREASIAIKKTSSKLLAKYLEDHPELVKDTAGIKPNDFASISFTSQIALDKLVAQKEQVFDEQWQKQYQLSSYFLWINPALLLQADLNAITGTGEKELRAFRTAVNEFYKSYQAFFAKKVIQQQKFTVQAIPTIPKPSISLPSAKANWGARIYLILLSLLFYYLGTRRLQNIFLT